MRLLDSPLRFAVATPTAIDEAIDLVASAVHAVPEPKAEPEGTDSMAPEAEHDGSSSPHTYPPLLLVEAADDGNGEPGTEAEVAAEHVVWVEDFETDAEPVLDVVEVEELAAVEVTVHSELATEADADAVIEAETEAELDHESDVEADAAPVLDVVDVEELAAVEVTVHSELATEADADAVIEAETEAELDHESDVGVDTGPVLDVFDVEELAAAEVTLRSEIATDLELLAHTHAEADVVADVDAGAVIEAETAAELDPESDVEAGDEYDDLGAEADAAGWPVVKWVGDVEADAEPVLDVVEAEEVATAELTFRSENTTEVDAEAEAEAEVDAETEAVVDPEPEAEVAVEALTDAGVEAETAAENEIETVVEAEVEVEARSRNRSRSRGRS